MSAGDSITSGLGARWSYIKPTLFVVEDCGVSFGTGGDDDIVSIAKLVENKWGNRVLGKSFGSRRVNLCIDRPANRVFCPRDPLRIRRKDDGYNVAISGATSEALPLQINDLKIRIEEDEINLKEERVLITLLIGANDLCIWDCHRPEIQFESFKSHVINFISEITQYLVIEKEANLDILIPEMPTLEDVPLRAKGSIMEPFAVLECPCSYNQNKSYDFKDRVNIYNQFFHHLDPQSPKAKLIVSNVLRREPLKDWPVDMTSKLDAFHPSKYAHSYFAREIFTDLENIYYAA